ncbi:MAG: alanine transaminase [Deltaproteobacteria bacterium GWC2_42_51]|nr:MAG: alanine transaminase [Deltaproteobacteria bacterium GWC2_42_51]OGP42851.1 MAG: alanine transaminase [Deltaproteobacteria bacterium GWD2_42_10]OGP45986.1 MAG: alanine transaminase [Deltaproteobacteria bacterium GWF2_42_12]OGQ30217.1 MAG: alanine transaminase [Deltaproteobacteria bacterium RIFCSPHIGHO2_02_FULL_42_44]OGQ36404.1 MAG: alanine transaminase [Deltaproteobacteria bacterium RIFCSPLOWO2_02_FULL_42_39]OGQ66149.1 MAG: alanine transaminase [Deltaproteobacteria bacterium RIFCSPLOWO2_
MEEFHRIKRLPPYIFNITTELKMEARRRGEDIIDFGMGNPDQPTPQHIVDKLLEAAKNPRNHRYSASKGIYKLRLAITDWYKRRYDVDLDPESEAIATIGSKEGLSHLALAIIGPGDVVFVPNPTYSIHTYCVVIAGGDVRSIPLLPGRDFFEELLNAVKQTWPKPKLLIINFPHNPTTEVVDIEFFKKIVDFAKEHNILVVHDLAYADIVFDGYKAPSFLQVPGAKDIGVEFFTLSKSYNMPGWRVGFAVGNKRLIGALARIKSYMDYGMFQPIQIAAISALNGPQECVHEICETYKKRRDVLISSFNKAGWPIEKPKATMFVWARIPEQFRKMGSLEFSKFLLREAKVAVSPGVGFGEYGDEYVRIALIENEHRTRQAAKGIKEAFKKTTEVRPKTKGEMLEVAK